jgi:lipid-binding SYLF domain-containing protein
MVTYKIGTGLVIALRADGTWSPPSAISTCGVGYGAQVSDLSSCFVFMNGAWLLI